MERPVQLPRRKVQQQRRLRRNKPGFDPQHTVDASHELVAAVIHRLEPPIQQGRQQEVPTVNARLWFLQQDVSVHET